LTNHQISDPDAEVLDEVLAEEYSTIHDALRLDVPGLNISEPTKPLGHGTTKLADLDFDFLGGATS
jgi:hypothetical protein